MTGFRIVVPPGVARTSLAVTVGLLAALAWATLWLAGGFGLQLHNALPGSGGVWLFLGGWTVMTVAMMLPASLPVLVTFQSFAAARPDRGLLVGLAVAGYLVTWTGFGAAVYALYLLAFAWFGHGVHRLGGPVILLLAGAFQFSPLKYRCLDKCRSPLTVVISHWRGAGQRWHAFLLGMGHGLYCVGCCWALMLLMFVVHAGSLLWMLALAIYMAVEKNVSWGRRMSAPAGALLVATGLALLVV